MSPYEEQFNSYFDEKTKYQACSACVSLYEVAKGSIPATTIASRVNEAVRSGYLLAVAHNKELNHSTACKWYDAFKSKYMAERLTDAIRQYEKHPPKNA